MKTLRTKKHLNEVINKMEPELHDLIHISSSVVRKVNAYRWGHIDQKQFENDIQVLYHRLNENSVKGNDDAWDAWKNKMSEKRR